jgi:hypothetical protein
MIWETPTFVEIRMDAEIGSYQEDGGRGDGPFFAERVDDEAVTASPRGE